MRIIKRVDFSQAVKSICRQAHYELDPELLALLQMSLLAEEKPISRDILQVIIENAQMAQNSRHPLCQDTGVGIFFIEKGEEVTVEGGDISGLISEAVKEVYRDESFRKSTVSDPLFDRRNSGDNLPPLIHWELVTGDRIKISFLPKGAGAENMSRLQMFHPLSGRQQIHDFVVKTVRIAGGNPCPPLIVGVGIGGSFDYAPLLAKKAILRPLKESNPAENWRVLEEEILESINNLNIGPMGLGGKTTALKVRIIQHPCHTASLPVAVNLQCHSHRCSTVAL